jgi:hypothetical protein
MAQLPTVAASTDGEITEFNEVPLGGKRCSCGPRHAARRGVARQAAEKLWMRKSATVIGKNLSLLMPSPVR